jgi:phage tail sheath protein FI
MPEYLTPGVYIEEFEIGAKPIEGVSTSTAGFLGETERGPTYPQLVTSFPEYKRLFGGFFGATKFLPYAVDGFFGNGGKRVFIARIVDKEGAQSAAGNLSAAVSITAVGEGTWGNRMAYRIKESTEANAFTLHVYYWSAGVDITTLIDPVPTGPIDEPTRSKLRKQQPPQHFERFENLSLDPASMDYVEKRVANGLSMLVGLKHLLGQTALPAPGNLTFLTGGNDGAAINSGDYIGRENPDPITGQKRSGLEAMKEPPFEDVAIMYAPNAFSIANLAEELTTHCENNKYRFLILDSLPGQAQIGPIDPRKDRPSQYAAFYYPWIRVFDADSGVLKFVPPGGHMAGIYARSDIERGVFKAPANEVVRGALELEFEITDGGQGILNPRGVNAIRAFPGRGRRVWGARTLSDNTLWKYVNVRRLFIFIEASIFRGTQWVVFEPNNERLWARVKQTITEFLRTQWRLGALLGATEEEAFFVKVDRSTMTDDDINNGRLVVVIGIAPTRPAEFVIFRIAQLTSSATSVQL